MFWNRLRLSDGLPARRLVGGTICWKRLSPNNSTFGEISDKTQLLHISNAATGHISRNSLGKFQNLHTCQKHSTDTVHIIERRRAAVIKDQVITHTCSGTDTFNLPIRVDL